MERYNITSVKNLDKMYFVHSYFVKLEDQKQILSETQYGNLKFCSSLKYKNIYATQFHPEKVVKWIKNIK